MKVYVPCRSEASAKSFKDRHPFFDDLRLLTGVPSLFGLINKIIGEEPAPCLLLHDDIYVDEGFPGRVEEGLGELEEINPRWGVAGNSGVALGLYGLEPSHIARYISDPHSGPNLPARIIPAESLDGNTLLLNAPLLRQKGVVLPEFGGFQLYDLVLCLEAIKSGLGCHILPRLLVYHDSPGNQAAFQQAVASAEFVEWARQTVSCSNLLTINGGQYIRHPRGKLTLPDDGLENCARSENPTVAIVVRSRFGRPALLRRAAQTIQAFIAASGMKDMFLPVIVSDVEAEDLPDGFQFRHFRPEEPLEDSRFYLVREAALGIDCDYMWFIDDDDWLFPNKSRLVALTLNSAPRGSTFHMASRHFLERSVAERAPNQSRAEAGRVFEPKLFGNSIYGFNMIPFCGIIFPTQSLREIFRNNDLSNILYYEDYCVELLNMYAPDYFPVVIDAVTAGISVRDDNTITSPDRTPWNKSASAVFSLVVQRANMLVSRPPVSGPTREEIMYSLPIADLKMLVARKFANKFRQIGNRLKHGLLGK